MGQVKEIIVGVVKRGDKFLILHRKPDKKFDPDKWEFVSGFIKVKDNLKEFTENQINYETGLNVKFIKSGRDFSVNDEYGEWLIHPFLFEAHFGEIVLQPEDHSLYKWVSPKDLKLYPTVKDLNKNLQLLDLL